MYVFLPGARRRYGPETKKGSQCGNVRIAGRQAALNQGLHFGRECQTIAVSGVVKRLDAETIARREEEWLGLIAARPRAS